MLTANDLKAVIGISLRYHSFIVYQLDISFRSLCHRRAFRAPTQIRDDSF
jgi:hypothetical protein